MFAHASKARPISKADFKQQWPTKSNTTSTADFHLLSLAKTTGVISEDTRDITRNEKTLLAALDDLNMFDAHLKQLSAVEAEEVEAESWNVDVLQEMIELSQKVGRIPFPLSDKLYNLTPSGPASKPKDNAGNGKLNTLQQMPNLDKTGSSASQKGKERAPDADRNPQIKRNIFNLHPRDAEKTWWSNTREEYGMFFPSELM